MMTEPISAAEQHARLDAMRAEFRTAQQRRDARRRAVASPLTETVSKVASDAEPPTVATPSR
jgi:hypothetical protein